MNPTPDTANALGNRFRRQIDLHPQRFEHVGAPAQTRRRAIAVLGDFAPRARHHERRRRGDVVGVLPVPARAARVYQTVSGVHLKRPRAHHGRHAGDLFGSLAPNAQGRHKRAELGGRRRAVHYLAHHRYRGVERQPASRNDLSRCINDHQLVSRPHSSR